MSQTPALSQGERRILRLDDGYLTDASPRSRDAWAAVVRKYVNPRLAKYADESATARPSVVPTQRNPSAVSAGELLVRAGVDVFVDLTDPRDGLAPYRDRLQELATEGEEPLHISMPIRDMDAVVAIERGEVIDAQITGVLKSGKTMSQEEREVLEALTEMGCDIAQGYVIGRPMSLESLIKRIATDRKVSVA